ncbi:MAG: histidine kinase [Nitrospirales bacterium]|nr:histidine kinase [Nitrospirales bacterium]
MTKTILVGVSDIFFYTKIRDAFRPQGYTLERVRKQEDVVGLLSKMEPMALIVNMNDDRLDATQILETVRSDSQAQHLPVLAFANHEEVQAWKEAKRLGINKIVSRNEFSARTLALLEEMIGASNGSAL